MTAPMRFDVFGDPSGPHGDLPHTVVDSVDGLAAALTPGFQAVRDASHVTARGAITRGERVGLAVLLVEWARYPGTVEPVPLARRPAGMWMLVTDDVREPMFTPDGAANVISLWMAHGLCRYWCVADPWWHISAEHPDPATQPDEIDG